MVIDLILSKFQACLYVGGHHVETATLQWHKFLDISTQGPTTRTKELRRYLLVSGFLSEDPSIFT